MKPTLFLSLALFAAPLFAASPAEIAIRQAMANVEKQPAHYPYYAELAAAYVRRARETEDVQFYAKAEETLKKSFALAPDNFEGLKVEAGLQLARHEFAHALEAATRLNKMAPDDLAVYGYLVDANVELGNYEDAIIAAQWMLNLREGNVPALTRAAYLRELHGKLDGALELMQMAYDRLPLSETEDRAWVLAQTARLQLVAGDLSKAGKYAGEALAIVPDYRDALAALAQVRIAQGRYDDAVSLLRKRYNAAPRAANLYALAEAQELAGEHEEAQASFRKFEPQARGESSMANNSNHELVSYYIDRPKEPAKALEFARLEVARRQDVFTLDSYAWALAANGDYAAAWQQLRKGLEMGFEDQKVLYHAGYIALRLQLTGRSEMYLKDAAARGSREAANLLQSNGN